MPSPPPPGSSPGQALSRFAVEGTRMVRLIDSDSLLPEQDFAFAADGLVAGEGGHGGRARGQVVEAGATAVQGALEQAEEGEVVAAAVGEGGEGAVRSV